MRSAVRMSSGLRCGNRDYPEYDPSLGYPDHLYLYTGGMNSFEWAATRPQQWPPNTVGRYRNCDPVLTNYLIWLDVDGRGEEYLSFPIARFSTKSATRGPSSSPRTISCSSGWVTTRARALATKV